MIKSVTFQKSTFADPPARFEAGTPDIAAVIGMGECLRFVKDELCFEAIHNHESLLASKTEAMLREVPGLTIIGPATPKVPVFSFTLAGIHPHDLGSILDQHGVAVRTGHHCAQPLLDRLGVTATARASFSIYNNEDDIEALRFGLHRCLELFA
jgi:cysteine desulfurase/selenocysteine lyase